MEYILEVENLTKNYKNSDFKLQNVELKLPYGSIIGLVGENGAGKTTLINTILNLRKKDEGSIKLFGEELLESNVEIKNKIGVVFDMKCFSDYSNAKHISKIYKSIYENWDEEFFYNNLKRFNIPNDRKIKDFSKGMVMSLSIITAMSYKPQLLILDEATSGLDPVHRDEMLTMFQEFVEDENKSILFSSHITSDLEKIADYVTFIKSGKVILSGIKDELVYEYGIVKCGKDYFENIDKNNIIKYLRKDFEYQVLIKDRECLPSNIHDFIVENPTLEEIIFIMSKGEN